MNLNDLLTRLSKAPLGQRIALLVLLLGLVCGGDYFLYYQDIANAETAAQQVQVSDNQELQAQQANQKNELEYRNEIQALEDQASKQEGILPSRSELPALIEQVSGQAQLAGVQITSWKVGPDTPEGTWVVIPVDMEVSGTFQEIGRFFNDLGQLPRIVNVENLTLDSPQTTEAGTTLHGSFTIESYRLPDTSASQPAGAQP
jgi:type IV pilus assembly protein PilO